MALRSPASSVGRAPSVERAIELAYAAVGRRERTVRELRRLLEGKGVGAEAVEAAVVELTATGQLDDARFALRFAEDKRALERWGAERIERELRRRGVADEHVAAALAQQDRSGELDAALALLAERLPEPPSDDRARARAWRMLLRRGYEPELAQDAVVAHGDRYAA